MLTPSLLIVTDFSGSMNELGKPILLRNRFRTLICLAKEVKLHCFSWRSAVEPLELYDDGELFATDFTGKADPAELACFLEDQLPAKVEEGPCLVLLLSDGRFSMNSITKYETWLKRGASRIRIRTVFIGADAEEENLKRLSTNSTAYAPEDIQTAFESLLYSRDSSVRPPVSLTEILSIKKKS